MDQPPRTAPIRPSHVMHLLRLCAASGALLLCAHRPVFALEADELALVINEKVPASRELAELYADARHVPAGRIIPLSIDDSDPTHPSDELPYRDYETKVAGPIRDFLVRNNLKEKVTCLVTFWGVPLRVGRTSNTPAEAEELSAIDDELKALRPKALDAIAQLESLAKQVNPKQALQKFPEEPDPALLAARSDKAIWVATAGILAMPEGKPRADFARRLIDAFTSLAGQRMAIDKLATPPLSSLSAHPVTARELADARQNLRAADKEASSLDPARPHDRDHLRHLARDNFGLLVNLKVLDAQYAQLQAAESEAALDSELALLWAPAYPRYRWRRNPLFWKEKSNDSFHPLMVARLDAPSLPLLKRLISTSIEVEQKGLKGSVVLDARGLPPANPYGQYDQTLRNLAALLRAKTTLKVIFDDKPALLPEYAQKDVALYCGWYSLHHYIPCCHFNPGAVGFHVASSELVSLHGQNETGWVHGLMSDGVVASLGPVAEPYLQSFPAADEFFPLLLTGKLTLAEVYWRTTPMVSWMQDLVGDPLYRPYAARPALSIDALPPQLRAAADYSAIHPPSTQAPIPDGR